MPPFSTLALSVAAVSTGAALGALLRWLLSLGFNQSWAGMPLGTLLANLIGGYGVGLAVGWFSQAPELPPALKLFVITGLLGGLTTFSTFSAEVVAMLQNGRAAWAFATAAAHVTGSLLLTWAGLASAPALLRWLRMVVA
jgi:fluoride exporter